MTKLLSIITPCFNEEKNIEELYKRISILISKYKYYNFEILFIDNASTDNTVKIIKKIAEHDSSVKLIINERNFGHIRSPYWGILQTSGDATIYMASDLQDPPELVIKFIEYWEQGWKVVLAAKQKENYRTLRSFLSFTYYKILDKLSSINVVRNASGFGIYDKSVIDQLRKINDPYPFLRGLICELGYDIKIVNFIGEERKAGISKNNFYSLYDIAMLGIISHSLIPLRLATFTGIIIGLFSIIIALLYAVIKILYWNSFPIGIAPLIIGIFFMFGILFIFIGVLGEYVASIQTYVKNRPIVVEKERINF
jgi:glycosyltransferase involved in cell wall biosynthesis